jgi:hypothetical protein
MSSRKDDLLPEHATRRRKLIPALLAAAAAGGLALSVTGLADAANTHPSAASSDSALQGDFTQAAKDYHLPRTVLMALSYQESRWETHDGRYSGDGGYGPMNLTDVTPAMLGGGDAGAAGRGDLASMASAPAFHTLQAAADLIGVPASRLKTDPAENIRGGAALLASYEKKLTGGTPADPSQWYGAVARFSQLTGTQGARGFADGVFGVLARGASRTTDDGQHVSLTAQAGVEADTGQLADLKLSAGASGGDSPDCPPTVHCTVLPAASTNYQQANRPADKLKIRYIVIHDTESTYQQAINAFQSPSNGAAANYVMQSSTGDVTEMVPNQDVAFHAGNYWFNMHAIGIEHEGFAAAGATWYTEAQYQATADLVKYLSAEYGIPLDRQHIIGHDNVPGPLDAYVAGMHWDPGPYWNWTHFMQLLGVPVPQGGHGGVPKVGQAVTITPDFQANQQSVEVCGQPTGEGGGTGSTSTTCTTRTQASNFLYVRTAPDASAPLFGDPAIHSGGAGTDHIDDWGSTVVAGQQFVVADVQGDWTAIWYSGAKVWFYNPGGAETTPAHGVLILSPKAGSDSAAVYGEGYPQPSEYPAGYSPSTQKPLSMYSVPAGQEYVADQPPVKADDFFATAGASHPADSLVIGSERYWTVQYNHRVALLNAADMTTRLG